MTTPNTGRVYDFDKALGQKLTNIYDLKTGKRLTQAEALKRVEDAKDGVARKAIGLLSPDGKVDVTGLDDILNSVRRVLATGGKE